MPQILESHLCSQCTPRDDSIRFVDPFDELSRIQRGAIAKFLAESLFGRIGVPTIHGRRGKEYKGVHVLALDDPMNVVEEIGGRFLNSVVTF